MYPSGADVPVPVALGPALKSEYPKDDITNCYIFISYLNFNINLNILNAMNLITNVMKYLNLTKLTIIYKQ
jgi:hypothetical protein